MNTTTTAPKAAKGIALAPADTSTAEAPYLAAPGALDELRSLKAAALQVGKQGAVLESGTPGASPFLKVDN